MYSSDERRSSKDIKISRAVSDSATASLTPDLDVNADRRLLRRNLPQKQKKLVTLFIASQAVGGGHLYRTAFLSNPSDNG